MQLQGFHHLALKVADVERVTAFYREVLGLPERVRHHHPDGRLRSVWLEVPGGHGAFLAVEEVESLGMEASRPERPGWHLMAFRIPKEARAAAERRLSDAGHPVVQRTQWTLYVLDPEGNRVGLSHHPEDAAS